ncbi:hypothetical protein AAG570_004210 [Ranatra chinensis]|uniref:Uncharacterized protein n=1 Tax=Ranatra chinensis TaxID=642074 RepID=A0ABD0Y3S8_9HEMI
MAPERRNTLQKNTKQETTEIVWHIRSNSPQLPPLPSTTLFADRAAPRGVIPDCLCSKASAAVVEFAALSCCRLPGPTLEESIVFTLVLLWLWALFVRFSAEFNVTIVTQRIGLQMRCRRFTTGEFDLPGKPGSGRPTESRQAELEGSKVVSNSMSATTAKTNVFFRKVMLCVWWDRCRILH